MAEPKTAAEMIGEALREMAVLVLVFGFLDEIFKSQRVSLAWGGKVLIVSSVLLFLGMLVELRRRA